MALLVLKEKRDLKEMSGLLDHRGPRALEQWGPRVKMGPLAIKDCQELTADPDVMELRGTRVNLESATAYSRCTQGSADLELQGPQETCGSPGLRAHLDRPAPLALLGLRVLLECKDLRTPSGRTSCLKMTLEEMKTQTVKGTVPKACQGCPACLEPRVRKEIRASLAQPPWTAVTGVWRNCGGSSRHSQWLRWVHQEFQECLDHQELKEIQVHQESEARLEHRVTWDLLVSQVHRAQLVHPVSRASEGYLASQD